MSEPLYPPLPTNPTDAFAILKWHQEMVDKAVKDAREELNSQMKVYLGVFSLALAVVGALLTFAGWIGYQEAVARIKGTLSEDIKAKIVNGAAYDLQRKVPDQIVAQGATDFIGKVQTGLDKRYVLLDENYSVKNFNSARFLDVLNAGEKQPYFAPVNATPDSRQTWIIVKK